MCDACSVFDIALINVSFDLNEINSSVIDISREILSSFQRFGYIRITGHGVSNSTISDSFKLGQSFFTSESSFKTENYSKDKARRGYSESSSENFGSLKGDSLQPNDLVEKFRIGPPILIDDDKSNYHKCKDGRVHFYPNIWPSQPEDFRETLTQLYQEISSLAVNILQIIEIGLNNRQSNILTKNMDKHTSILSLNYYNELDMSGDENGGTAPVPAIIRVAEHTDVSMITIVAQSLDASRTWLEIFQDGQWIKIPYMEDSLIVHIGDCLEDWSRGLLKSVLHRVVSSRSPASAVEQFMPRMSLAFFVSPNYDALMEWKDDVISEKSPDNTVDTNYSLWRKQRIRRAQRALKGGIRPSPSPSSVAITNK